MTTKQLRLLDFIAAMIRARGISPTYAEMREHMAVKSKNAVSLMVTSLVEQGYLIKTPGVARGLRLATCPKCGAELHG